MVIPVRRRCHRGDLKSPSIGMVRLRPALHSKIYQDTGKKHHEKMHREPRKASEQPERTKRLKESGVSLVPRTFVMMYQLSSAATFRDVLSNGTNANMLIGPNSICVMPALLPTIPKIVVRSLYCVTQSLYCSES